MIAPAPAPGKRSSRDPHRLAADGCAVRAVALDDKLLVGRRVEERHRLQVREAASRLVDHPLVIQSAPLAAPRAVLEPASQPARTPSRECDRPSARARAPLPPVPQQAGSPSTRLGSDAGLRPGRPSARFAKQGGGQPLGGGIQLAVDVAPPFAAGDHRVAVAANRNRPGEGCPTASPERPSNDGPCV